VKQNETNLSLHVCLITYCIRVYKSGKFGAVIAAIPLPIIAAVYCVLFAYVGMYDLFVINYNFISLRYNNYIILMLVCKN